jgi:hypothetical protein
MKNAAAFTPGMVDSGQDVTLVVDIVEKKSSPLKSLPIGCSNETTPKRG